MFDMGDLISFDEKYGFLRIFCGRKYECLSIEFLVWVCLEIYSEIQFLQLIDQNVTTLKNIYIFFYECWIYILYWKSEIFLSCCEFIIIVLNYRNINVEQRELFCKIFCFTIYLLNSYKCAAILVTYSDNAFMHWSRV